MKIAGKRTARVALARLWVTLAALLAASALVGQTLPERLDAARAAEARLDFRAALSDLAAAIEAAPNAPAPRLARAALHLKMRRPSLALADLAAVLEMDPANRAALLARAGLFSDLGALSRALDDYDHLLEAYPDDVAGLIGRAKARTRSGLTRLARRDYDAALALAPATPGLAAARAALDAPVAAASFDPASFKPALLMDPAFQIAQGRSDAPHSLIVFHAGNRLAEERLILPTSALAEAVEAGRLRVVHQFTYTGQDSAIWANRGLICAGAQGFGAVAEALATPDAGDALDRIDAGLGRDAFEALLRAAYGKAGLDAKTAMACATDRAAAFAYLSEWSAKEEAAAARQNGLYDSWPLFVLDGKVVSATVVLSALGETRAGPAPQTEGARDGEQVASAPPPDPATNPVPKTGPELPFAPARAPTQNPDPLPVPPSPDNSGADPALSQPPRSDTAPAPLPPVPETDIRVPVDLKGIWAASLAACITYTDSIAGADQIDAALPALNPLDGPPVGTVLLTSRGLRLFNAVGTVCTPTDAQAGRDGAWNADLRCENAIDPSRSSTMTLTRLANAATAPRLAVNFGNHTGITLIQCRPLGRLSADFGRLWQIAPEACAVRAPIRGGQIAFAAADGALSLVLTADDIPVTAPGGVSARIDGAPLATAAARPASGTAAARKAEPRGSGDGPATASIALELGDYTALAQTLARGLLLELRLEDPQGRAQWQRMIPLLGSSQAMDALADCAMPAPTAAAQ